MAVKTFYFFGSYSSAPTFRPFIMRVNSGVGSTFTIPTGVGYTYNYDVKTSDGQVFSGVTGNLTITFPATLTDYDIEISGEFPYFNLYFGSNQTNRNKVIDVVQWGDVEIKSLFASFGVTTNMSSITANDTPKIISIINGDSCFSGSGITSINNFDLWDMSKFNDLSQFFGRSSYNQPVDWSNPVTGSINTTSMWRVMWLTPVPSFKAQCGNVATSDIQDFTSTTLSELILLDWKVNLWINNTPLLVGTAIDNLFTSLGTANTGATITISTAQSTSGIDTTIATSKGWTIIVV